MTTQYGPARDPINPDYYKAPNGLEAIHVIEAFGLNYNLGNSLEYILRAGKKDDARQDLDKAIWYLQREKTRLATPPPPPPPAPMASFSNAGMDEARQQQLGSDFSYGEPVRMVPRQLCPADDVTPGEEPGTFISRRPPASNA